MRKRLLLSALALPLVLVACGGSPANDTATVRYAVTTTAVSVPALASGITLQQVKQLVSDYTHLSSNDIEVKDYETFGDWAVAKVYSSKYGAEGMVFKKQNHAWFLKLAGVDTPSVVEAGAPADVSKFFGY